MTHTVTIRRGTTDDHDVIEAMLREAGILPDGLEQSAGSFILAETTTEYGIEIAAMVGFEKYEHQGLLRSFVIRTKAWTSDDTLQLLNLAIAHAHDSGVQAIYLLTQSPSVFVHIGFTSVEPTDVPAEMLQSRHFSRNIKHAVPMRKVLA